jgi:hypothetical protein
LKYIIVMYFNYAANAARNASCAPD